jgi:hypothetical protein
VRFLRNALTAAMWAVRSVRLIPEPAQATALLAALFAQEELTAAHLIERHLSRYGVLETWDSLMSACIASVRGAARAGAPATHKRVDR